MVSFADRKAFIRALYSPAAGLCGVVAVVAPQAPSSRHSSASAASRLPTRGYFMAVSPHDSLFACRYDFTITRNARSVVLSPVPHWHHLLWQATLRYGKVRTGNAE